MSDDKLYNKFQVEVDDAVKSRVQYERQKIKRILIIGSVIVLIIIIAVIVGVVASRKSRDKSGGTGYVKETRGCKSFSRPALVLVSIDGFPPDYLKTNLCPNINKLAKNGVEAEGMRTQFPTKTYPNIYSWYTGLYPESHGIVSNIFLNANRTEKFHAWPRKGQKTDWYKGDPIWVTAKSQGVKSAVYYLYDVDKVKERRPTYWLPFDNEKASYEQRVDKTLSWLEQDSSKRPYFISVYFGEVDIYSHRYGPQAQETFNSVKKVDRAVERLMKGIKQRNLSECTNVIVVSDHGMANISCSRAMYLDQMISLKDVKITELGTIMFLYTKNQDHAKNLTEQLKCKSKNLRVYSRYDGSMPKRLHFTHNKRIGDIILVPTVGWQILINSGSCLDRKRGDHGYDDIYPEMLALFIANGPSFKSGLVIPQFSSVEIYNVMADILKLTPGPNNGTIGSLSHILKNPKDIVKPFYNGDGNNFSNCTFPKNLSDAISKCKYCVDYYCSREIKSNLTFYRKSLNLSANEINTSFQRHFPWGVPKGGAGKGGCILTQKHYIIGYSWYLHIPLWVGYHLTAKQLRTNIPRKNCFRRDIRLTSQQSSFLSDYSSSGYDRGHIAPSGDFNFERVAEQDTFILSNIAPQNKYFNRNPGLWFKSEDVFRTWAMKYDSVFVISGSIFDADGDGFRDKDSDNKRWTKNKVNGVAIPTHFYKIIVRCSKVNVTTGYKIPNCKGKLESLSFIFPHNTERDCKLRDWTTRLLEYTASIRDIERLTGHNLFPNLPFPYSAQFKTHLPSKLWPIS